MMNSPCHISNLLEKMCSVDKDFRFMATNDFMNELQKDNIKLDDASERKVVRMVLKLLEDKNCEVQNVAVKCLGPLIQKVQDYQVETIADILCTNMTSENEQLRDISSIGLKTVVSELSVDNQNFVGNLCRHIAGRLIGIIDKQEDVSVQLEALDILIDLLSRFGPLLVTIERQILNCLLPQLGSSRQAVRKRTIVALGYFVSSCSTFVYSIIIDNLLQSVGPPIQPIHKTYIQCLAVICRYSGHRFGQHIGRIASIILTYFQEEDEELLEYCLQAFEIFINRCAKEMAPYMLSVIDLCLQLLKYDPNYNYGIEFDGGLGAEDECSSQENIKMETEEQFDEEESNDEYSDDDDMSWKIRRVAAKCLETIVLNGDEFMVTYFYRYVSPILIDRFKEREHSVKSDIFHTFLVLLRKTKAFLTSGSMGEENPIVLLEAQIPCIVKHIYKLMRDRNAKTKQDCFILLKELITVLPGALTNYVDVLISGIQHSLMDKNSNIRISVLNFLSYLFSTHAPEIFYPYMNVFVSLIITAVGDNFYKVSSEALQALQELVKVIRPLEIEILPEFTTYMNDLYHCTLGRLYALGVDQEVKERAIECMAQILYNTGDYLQTELDTCLPIFLDRLKNEITRVVTIKGLNKIASSPLQVGLNCILGDVLLILSFFLRKNQRLLKIETLILLNTLVRNYYSDISIELLQQIIVEIPPLISESDLLITQLTLTVLISICEFQPHCLVDQTKGILSEIVVLVQSPMLQGVALQAVLDFLQILIRTTVLAIAPCDLLYVFVQQGAELCARDAQKNIFVVQKQALHSLAKCVAAIVVLNDNEALVVIKKFLSDLREVQTDANRVFILFIIGEIGRHVNLDSIPKLKEVILEAFTAPSEEVKLAASYTLGGVAVGNMESYVPFILKEIDTKPKLQYLLLHSLKEVISSKSCTPMGVESLLNFLSPIWSQLFKYCELTEEGPRNIVAECLGKLTLMHPEDLLSRLQVALTSPSPFVRGTVITTIKYTIMEQPQLIDPLLHECMPEFLKTLEDPDLNVRRMALITFNSAARNKPSLIRDLLPNLLPQLYKETKIKSDLIRELEMGPFKHTVDEGLDIRKAAFECMYTLLETCLDKLQMFEFLDHIEGGLKDHYDIKMLTYLMVIRLTQLCPTIVLQRLEQLVAPIRATCTLKLKGNSVKQEYEKHEELKRSAIRAVAALYNIPDASKNPVLMEFVNHIKITSDLKSVFETVRKESNSSVRNFETGCN